MKSSMVSFTNVALVLLSTTSLSFALLHAQTPQEAPIASNISNTSNSSRPFLIDLRRETVPVRRKGEIVSHKTSYSGVVSVGVGKDNTPQEFRVVFDTGSGHVVFPSVECASESCLVHRQYNMSKSSSSTSINADGSLVKEGENSDQVKVGFGTGSITGEFVRDTVCLGSASADETQSQDKLCTEMHVVMAVEMSTTPFKNFGFDGIMGLGLKVLALSPQFSFFDMLTQGRRSSEHKFGVFLTDGEEGETSEIAFGGHNEARLQEPLAWSPVTQPELGYWLVDIVAFRIDGVEMDFCKDGVCRGVMDTGTSHLGVPAPYDKVIAEQLTRDAGDLTDCRNVKAPVIQIEIKGLNITLQPENYMRPIPLKAGISVGSSKGVALPGQAVASTTMPPALVRDDGLEVEKYCRPRLMPVNLPAPVGPKLFILGEPVLQRYYTVFDWKSLSIGMGLSTAKQNMNSRRTPASLNVHDEIILVQVTITVRPRSARAV